YKAYKTYLGHATGAVPPKIARKFKKASLTKKDNDLVTVDEEPVTKGKRVKISVKKSLTKPATGIVIREPPVETKSKGKEKEKVDVAYGKGIELLFEVALTEKAQLKEVRKKSLRDFHKTHHSGSGTIVEDPPSIEKITPTITSEGIGDKPEVPDVTKDDSTKPKNDSEEQACDLEQEEESDDDDQEEEEFVHTPSPTHDKDDDNLESENARLEEPTQTGNEIVQGEGADVEMNESQQGNENLETTQEQVLDDAHVTITTTKKTKVPVTSSSRSSDLASKFLNFSDIPLTDAEIVSPLDVHVHHEVPRTQTPTLLTIPILPKEVSNFAPPVIEKLIKESRDEVTLAKVSSQPQSTYEAASTLTEFELKKILLDKMDKNKDKDEDPSARSDRGLKKTKLSKDVEPTTGPKKKDSTSGSSKGTKSQPKSSGKSVQLEEPVFEVTDSDMPQDQEGNLGDNEDETKE
ncbi:hypothetical protein Tco_1568623, partial [Tanacetum coccineum]